MVTDEQVRLLRQKRMEGKTQEAAATAAGMGVRTARKWESGPLPSEQTKSRTWRSRHDPFAGVWEEEIVPLLQRDEDRVLQATTVLELLETRHPGRFGAGQLRTLQRRIRDWRALYGSDQEVYFEQVHPPGREAQVDFTHATELGVRVTSPKWPAHRRGQALSRERPYPLFTSTRAGDSRPLPGSTSDNSPYVKYGPEELSPPSRARMPPALSMASVITSKAAIHDHRKSGHLRSPGTSC